MTELRFTSILPMVAPAPVGRTAEETRKFVRDRNAKERQRRQEEDVEHEVGQRAIDEYVRFAERDAERAAAQRRGPTLTDLARQTYGLQGPKGGDVTPRDFWWREHRAQQGGTRWVP